MWRISFLDNDLNFVVAHIVEGTFSDANDYACKVLLTSEVFLRKIVFERIE